MASFALLAVQARRIRRQRRLLRRAAAPVAPPAPVALAPVAPATVVRLVSVENVEWDSTHLGLSYHCGCLNSVSVWIYSNGYKSLKVSPFSPQVKINIPVVSLEAWDDVTGFRVRCSCDCGCGCLVRVSRDEFRGFIKVILL